MMYVIDLSKGFVTHESRDRTECERYIRNSQELFGAGPFTIANGAVQRNQIIRDIKERKGDQYLTKRFNDYLNR